VGKAKRANLKSAARRHGAILWEALKEHALLILKVSACLT